jgi:myosin heavy subunit
MKTIIEKKIVFIAGFAIIAALLAVAGVLQVNNTKLKDKISGEKIKSENLLSQKLQLDKSLDLTKKDLTDIKGKNSSLEKMILDTNQKIIQKNTEISRLKAQNASMKDLQKKMEELEKLKHQLSEEIQVLNKTLAQANAENLKLNNKIATSAKTTSELSADNSILRAIVSDNYRTEALRGKNDKLTVNARRTNKLMISFDLPANVSAQEFYFTITTPEGNQFASNKDLVAEIEVAYLQGDLMASTNKITSDATGKSRVEMSYLPNQKLTRGIYTFNLYNSGRFLGSTQLRLK